MISLTSSRHLVALAEVARALSTLLVLRHGRGKDREGRGEWKGGGWRELRVWQTLKSKGKRWRQHSCRRGGNELRVERRQESRCGCTSKGGTVGETRYVPSCRIDLKGILGQTLKGRQRDEGGEEARVMTCVSG
jgi:hypothetical protein